MPNAPEASEFTIEPSAVSIDDQGRVVIADESIAQAFAAELDRIQDADDFAVNIINIGSCNGVC